MPIVSKLREAYVKAFERADDLVAALNGDSPASVSQDGINRICVTLGRLTIAMEALARRVEEVASPDLPAYADSEAVSNEVEAQPDLPTPWFAPELPPGWEEGICEGYPYFGRIRAVQGRPYCVFWGEPEEPALRARAVKLGTHTSIVANLVASTRAEGLAKVHGLVESEGPDPWVAHARCQTERAELAEARLAALAPITREMDRRAADYAGLAKIPDVNGYKVTIKPYRDGDWPGYDVTVLSPEGDTNGVSPCETWREAIDETWAIITSDLQIELNLAREDLATAKVEVARLERDLATANAEVARLEGSVPKKYIERYMDEPT
jgi:hypothetical protein